MARWFAASQPVEALVIDDTAFPKDGTASPCVARQYSGTLGKVANCQVGVSVHLVNERASCAADWRLFCPQSWDDHAAGDEVTAAASRRRRQRAHIPDKVRHTEKWRLAVEMIEEMTGPGGWGVLEEITAAGGARPAVVADAGYGDNTAFRLELDARGWRYAVAVKGSTSACPGDAQPVTRGLGGGPGRPPRPACPSPPATLRQLAIASADQVRQVTWRQGEPVHHVPGKRRRAAAGARAGRAAAEEGMTGAISVPVTAASRGGRQDRSAPWGDRSHQPGRPRVQAVL